MSSKLTGTGVALVTPFHSDGSIDFKSYKKLINNLITNKVDYVVPMGTTGESVTLSKDEKKAIFDITLETVDGRVPVVAGVGGNNTRELCDSLNHFDKKGFTAILSVAPYYNKPNQEGHYQHYRMLSEHSPLPVILYNVPGRTGANMTAETTLRLAHDFKNIIAVKEASGNIDQMMSILKHKPKNFQLISGDDGITLPLVSLGAIGVISVVANAWPKDYAQMVRYALAGDFEKARKLHYKLTDIINLLFADGSPGGIKTVLKLKGICGDTVRLPLVVPSDAVQKKLKAAVEQY
jgi:4-hydroxy-tetrahydrodipicolinate synthase